MINQTDPKTLLDQADDLLFDINQANVRFINRSNQLISKANQNLKQVDKLNADLEKVEHQALAKINGHVLDYLTQNEE